MAGLPEKTVAQEPAARRRESTIASVAAAGVAVAVDEVLLQLVAGGLSCSVVSALLNPADVIKVRVVTTNELGRSAAAGSLSFSAAAREIVSQEGLLALWRRGLVASVAREISYSSIRMGLYDPIKQAITPAAHSGDIGLPRKVIAGLVSGSIGSSIATPTDVIKIRMQAERPDRPLPYRNFFHALLYIYREEGIRGLYRGVMPTVLRASLLTSSQLSSYDHSKHMILSRGLANDGPLVHIGCGLFSALVTTTVCNPADVLKTRWMNSMGTGMYTGPVDCLVKTVRHDGFACLFRGWLANFARLGPHFVISLPFLEATRKLLGLSGV